LIVQGEEFVVVVSNITSRSERYICSSCIAEEDLEIWLGKGIIRLSLYAENKLYIAMLIICA